MKPISIRTLVISFSVTACIALGLAGCASQSEPEPEQEPVQAVPANGEGTTPLNEPASDCSGCNDNHKQICCNRVRGEYVCWETAC